MRPCGAAEAADSAISNAQAHPEQQVLIRSDQFADEVDAQIDAYKVGLLTRSLTHSLTYSPTHCLQGGLVAPHLGFQRHQPGAAPVRDRRHLRLRHAARKVLLATEARKGGQPAPLPLRVPLAARPRETLPRARASVAVMVSVR